MMRGALALLTLLALAGCATSEVPITSQSPQTDARLLGTWHLTVEDTSGKAVIARNEKGELIATVSEMRGPIKPDPDRYRILVARVAGHWYMSLTVPDPPPGKSGYILARYEFETPDRFVLFGPKLTPLLDAVRRKEIAGEEKKGEGTQMARAHLTGTEAELRAFVAKRGPELFDLRSLVFDRMR